MPNLRRLRLRLRSLLRPGEVERELADEMAFHLERQALENRRAGMPEEEARREARRQFGGVVQHQEACRDHLFGWLERFGQDLRHALRGMRKAPGFTAFVVLSLAFGIGTNVAVFSLVHTVLLEQLPFRDPERLVRIDSYSVPDYEDYAEHKELFSGVAAWVDESMSLVAGGAADTVHGARATASFFPVLGVRPGLGRGFREEEDRPGGARVAVLSYRMWQSRFGGDPQILGRTIRLNAETLTVIGVLPASFWFPGEPVDVWVPRVFENAFVPPQMVRDGSGILTGTLARLRPDVTLERAEAAVQSLNIEYRRAARSFHHVERLAGSIREEVRPSLLLLWGAAGCILLVTCANTASLFLARATARRREIAVRLALGVSRARLAQQLLTESLPFGVAGGALGMLLARAGVAAVAILTGQDLMGWREVSLGGPVTAFAGAASLVCVAVFGMAPVVDALRRDPKEGLRDSSRGASAGRPRMRNALVVVQTAVAIVLAVGAALLLESYARMRLLKTGVQPEGLVTASLRLPDARYPSGPERARFYDELLRRLRELPGVNGAGAASALQLKSAGEGSMTWPEGFAMDPEHPDIVRNRSISPDYFGVLGIPLVAGRGFTASDDARRPNVMLVNESFARKYFVRGEAIGRRVTYSSLHVTCQIVGMVADVRPRMTDAGPQPEMYFPYMQRSRHEMSLVLRSRLAPGDLERAVRRELRAVDPEQPLYEFRTMREVIGEVLRRPRSTTAVVGFFSGAALVLAAIGIYGVLAFSVTQRSREIRVRLALGAEAGHIRRMVVGQSLRLIGAGALLGIPGAVAAGRLFSSLLFGVRPGDPGSLGAVLGVVLAVGCAAAYLPARRATRIDPAGTLRSE